MAAFQDQVTRKRRAHQPQNSKDLIVKKTIVTLIAGLFATAAFAQSPAPATTPATPSAVKAEAKHEKQEAKAEVKVAEAKEAKVVANADAK